MLFATGPQVVWRIPHQRALLLLKGKPKLLNPELDDFISSELSALAKETAGIVPLTTAPPRLYHLVNATELDELLRTGVMQAWHSRLATHAAIAPYGIALVEQWMKQRFDLTLSGPQRAFCDSVIQGLNPCGTHFDFFVTRLFATAAPPDSSKNDDGFALGLRCNELLYTTGECRPDARIMIQSAIYDEAVQTAIVETLYSQYEKYFTSSVSRFGEKNAGDLMLRCIDCLRRDLGAVMVRFRQPAQCVQHEWLAIALGGRMQQEHDVRFDVVHGQFAPYVGIDLCVSAGEKPPRLALAEIAVGASLPFAVCQENLLARLRASDHTRKMTRPAIRIIPASLARD